MEREENKKSTEGEKRKLFHLEVIGRKLRAS